MAFLPQGIHGLNQLKPPKETSEIVKFLTHFFNPFMILLEVAGVLCYISYAVANPGNTQDPNLTVGCILFGICLAQSFISYIQVRRLAKMFLLFETE